MAPDPEVSLSLLESTAGSLSMLIAEFTNAPDIESSSAAAAGERNLVGALQVLARSGEPTWSRPAAGARSPTTWPPPG